MPDTPHSTSSRRTLLRRLAACVAGAPALGLAACRRAAPRERPTGPHTSVRLADVPDGGRLVVAVADRPVEIRRRGHELEARSMLCTHMGCPLRWVDRARHYECPCHGGRFDAEGRAFAGPPARGLDRTPVFLDGDIVTVYGPARQMTP